jgi:hypothetical protein
MNNESTSYCIWKWADNKLPGKPNEVFAELMAGRMPSSLQPFKARSILRLIERLALQDCAQGQEWEWQVQNDDVTGDARFVYVTGPEARFDVFAPNPHLGGAIYRSGLSAYDERLGRLAYGGPKLVCFEFSDSPWAYDFVEEDLPVLLRQINGRHRNPTGVIVNRRQDFVGIANNGGVYHSLEWRTWIGRVEGPFEQWKAFPRRKPTRSRKSDGLSFGETLQIIRAFYRGEPRPASCNWRDITAQAQTDQSEIRRAKR